MQKKSLLAYGLITAIFLLPQAYAEEKHTIIIEGMKFIPAKLSVKMGDKITWGNKDFFPHTASAVDKSFNSKTIPAGKSWTLVAKKKGAFSYKCLFHTTMTGILIVE